MTLEEYAVAKLQEKDKEILENNLTIGKLMSRIDELEAEIDYQRRLRKKFARMFEIRQWQDGTGMYVSFDCGSSNAYSEERIAEFYEAVNYLGLQLPEPKKQETENES